MKVCIAQNPSINETTQRKSTPMDCSGRCSWFNNKNKELGTTLGFATWSVNLTKSLKWSSRLVCVFLWGIMLRYDGKSTVTIDWQQQWPLRKASSSPFRPPPAHMHTHTHTLLSPPSHTHTFAYTPPSPGALWLNQGSRPSVISIKLEQ